MVATVYTQVQGTRSAALLTMSTLAGGTYIASSSIDLGANIPLDATFECTATMTSPVGNRKVDIFAVLSLDNTNFSSGPTSLTTTTDEPDLHYIGSIQCWSTGTHTKMLSISSLPVTRYLKLVAKNDTGVALTSGFVYRADITGSSV